eukprot:52801_1
MSSSCSFLAELARWLYFILSILAVMNSFIHLHIQFEMTQCTELLEPTAGITCIGRNLGWQENDNFDVDTNKLFWRQTFSLSPDIFFDIWPPVIVSLLAFSQHFDTFQWDTISGDWGRSFLFILVMQLFTVLGYGSNFGVVVGFIGFVVAALYCIVCVLLLIGFIADTDIRDHPVLDLTEYLAICKSVGGQTIASDVNHDHEEQHPLSPVPVYTDNAQDILNRLSLTQPGAIASSHKINKKQNEHNYNQIVEIDIESNDEEDISSLSVQDEEQNDIVLIPPPAPAYALPTVTPEQAGDQRTQM